MPMPHADFTPTMEGYSGQGAFRFWCQKVLPLVYDDSLSYYELLAKMVVYLNNTISDVAAMETNVEALHEAYVSLQQFVNDYVDTLDFPAEVNRHLDEMAANGTLTTLMLPYLAETVGDWLLEHLTPTEPPVDDTLTIPNAAADSATVGDYFDRTMITRGSIPAGADLDDYYQQSGMYYANHTITGGITNSPWSDTGWVLLVKASSTPSTQSGQAQIAMSLSGGFAFRTRYLESWRPWTYIGDEFDPLTMTVRGNITAGSDLDDYYQYSGMYYVTTDNSSLIDHSPWSGHRYCLFVKSASNLNSPSSQVQYAISWAGELAYRFRFQEEWTSWKVMVNPNMAMSTKGSIRSGDLNDYYTESGMYYCSIAYLENIENLPWNNTGCALFVKAGTGEEETPSGQAQYAISNRGDFAFRTRYQNEWYDWNYAATNTEIPYISLAVFSKIGIMGGSYDDGSSFNPDGPGASEAKNVWINILAREYGFDTGVYAYHGTSIPEWFNPNYAGAASCYALFDSDTPCELYLPTFGANDTINGSIADCAAFDADPTQTPTTYYGWYAKLLHTIKLKAPDCRIIICMPASSSIMGPRTEARAANKEIAEYYELPLLDLLENPEWRNYAKSLCSKYTGHNYHPTPLGYAFMAKTYDAMISRTILDYASYFNTWRNWST